MNKNCMFKKAGVAGITLFLMISMLIPIVDSQTLRISSDNNFNNNTSEKSINKILNIFNQFNSLDILADVWDVTLEFDEPGGAYCFVKFGEKTDASDGVDSYDVPMTTPGFPPYIRSWFATNFTNPYHELWEEYKKYPDSYKTWNLTIQWVPSDYSSPTTITVSWNNNSVANSEYNTVVLYDKGNEVIVSNMLVNTSYTFTCPAVFLQSYTIICDTNLPPVANDDSDTVDEDSTDNQIDVLANDTDPNGDNLTIISVTQPSNGSTYTDGNYSYYTPNTNYNGADSFTYTISDGKSESDTAIVNITVTPQNDPPVAFDDFYSTSEDTVLSVPAVSGVLSNDSDIDNDTLTAVLVSDVSNGSLSLSGDGSFVYTPFDNFTGVDVFTYVANDSFVDSNVAIVNITVLPVSDAPIVNDDFYNTNEDTTLNVAAPGVLANDTDPDNDTISALLVSNPSNGTLSLNSNGSFVYSPDSDYYGSDNFTYKATDGVMVSNNATVFITIIAINDPPIANDDFYSTREDTPLNVTAPGVLLNDTDIDNITLTTEKVSDPAHGYLIFNSDGSFEYISDAEYIGYDSFTYRSYDGINYSNNATVHIDITDVNDPPVANDDTAIVGENTVDNEINVLLNDFDNENDKLIITSVTQPGQGTVVYNNDYVYYTPDPGYTGPDQFEYYITDGNGGFDNAIVDITVIHINYPPDAPIISGPPRGTPGLEYQYAFVSTDPEGDLIYYEILWGDGTFEGWLGPYNSDQVVSVSHSWSTRGFYTIMARAKDTHGAMSEWGTLDVLMPRDKAVTNSFILRFLERLFYKFPLLRLLGLQFGIYSPKHLNTANFNNIMTGG